MADLVSISAALTTPLDSARAYVKAAKADATRKAYTADWARFQLWCQAHNIFNSLPASVETVAMYLASLADEGYAVSSIDRALSAIAEAHRAAGYQALIRASAPVRSVMQGIRRKKGTAQRQVAPITLTELRLMVDALPPTLAGIRDRAILLLGFAGAFRRSEIVGLETKDLEFNDDGIVVTLRRSKTDQEGAGRKVGIPRGHNGLCPVRAVRAWLEATGGGPNGRLFIGMTRHGRPTGKPLDGKDIARLVKRTAAKAGLDASRFSGHSLRAGLVTTAARAGKSERAIMDQTGHRSVLMVRRYIRDAGLFSDNAADGIGL